MVLYLFYYFVPMLTIYKRNDLDINTETTEIALAKDKTFRKLSNNLFVLFSDYQEMFENHKLRMLELKKDMRNFPQIIHKICVESCLEQGILANKNKY